MLGFLILAIFAIFAALMFTRKMPALLAVPLMAIVVAALVGHPFNGILKDIVSDGVIKLAPAYVAVFAGAMLGRIMMQTGIAEGIIKRAAEFGGDRPLIVAFILMIATAVLFTTLTGLGAIIMVGTLVLPIMMSLGLPRKLVSVLFVLAFATGFIFNIALWTLYRQILQIAPEGALPAGVSQFAFGLLVIMTVVVVIYSIVAAGRAGEISLFAMASKEELTEIPKEKRVPLVSFLTPFVPLVLYLGLGWKEVPAFLGGAVFALITTVPRRAIQTLTAALVRGIEDGAPAAILMMGIGMLLNALRLPAVEAALKPIVVALPVQNVWGYVLFFGLLSPLALYRGPLNLFGVGIGVYSLMFALGILPPLALLAAMMSVTQVQNVCDPTNTHSVWVANFTGVRVEEITRATLLPMMIVALGGLILGAFLFLR
ncbi:MAG: citrate transporter [Acidobacteriota bacterium]|nr:citrate transporter [Acidobacteriota bacterium]